MDKIASPLKAYKNMRRQYPAVMVLRSAKSSMQAKRHKSGVMSGVLRIRKDQGRSRVITGLHEMGHMKQRDLGTSIAGGLGDLKRERVANRIALKEVIKASKPSDRKKNIQQYVAQQSEGYRTYRIAQPFREAAKTVNYTPENRDRVKRFNVALKQLASGMERVDARKAVARHLRKKDPALRKAFAQTMDKHKAELKIKF